MRRYSNLLLWMVVFFQLSNGLLYAKKTPPNVVIILVDDLGWRDLQCYGSDLYETPFIDKFATTGMQFSDAYSASPLCSPTRASILTGKEPGRLKLTTASCHSHNVILEPKEAVNAHPHTKATIPQSCTRLKNSYTTLGESFKALGYSTAFMGKWHLGRAPYIPDNQGFDVVVGGREHPGPPGGFFSPWKCETLPLVPEGTHLCDALTDTAISYVSHHRDEPFMMCLWYYDVHAPFQAKQDLIDKYASKITDNHIQRDPIMGSMVENLDANVGRFLNHLTSLDLDDNTIVVLTSDNGGNMYNCPNGQLATNNFPLREGKGNNYEGGVRIPLIVRAPGVTLPNTTSPVVVSTVDHYVTLMNLVGEQMSDSIVTDGQTYLPALKGAHYDRKPIFSAFCHRTPKAGNLPNISMREKQWKLYRFYYDGPNDTHRYELYNLEKDLSETTNLAYVYPERLEQMIKTLNAHIEEADYLESRLNKKYCGNANGAWWGSDDTHCTIDNDKLVISVTDTFPYVETEMVPGFANGQFLLCFDMKSTASGGSKIIWKEDRKKPYSNDLQQGFKAIHDGHWHHYEVLLNVEKVASFAIVPCSTCGTIELKDIQMRTTDHHLLRDWSLAGF